MKLYHLAARITLKATQKRVIILKKGKLKYPTCVKVMFLPKLRVIPTLTKKRHFSFARSAEIFFLRALLFLVKEGREAHSIPEAGWLV